MPPSPVAAPAAAGENKTVGQRRLNSLPPPPPPPLDPALVNHYRKKMSKERLALTGLQLLEKSRRLGLPASGGLLKRKIYRFLREGAVQRGPSFARRDRTKHYQGTVAFKPGVYFVDYGEFHKEWKGRNDGATGFLVAVENLTNRLFVLPTRGKDTKQWMESLSKFVETVRQVSVVYSDRDSVASQAFRQKVQEDYGLRWYFLKKGHKSFLAERYVGFVKTKLSQALESDQTLAEKKRWVDLVEPLVSEYNRQLVPGTSFRRQAVNRDNHASFLSQLLGTPDYDLRISGRVLGPFENERWNRSVFAFDLGDKVRVSRKADWTDPENRAGFKKSSTVGGFGSRIYTVSGRQLRATKDGKRLVPVYRLAEIKDGGFVFYENELVRDNSSAYAPPPATSATGKDPADSLEAQDGSDNDDDNNKDAKK